MPNEDRDAPATKQDIRQLAEDVGQIKQDVRYLAEQVGSHNDRLDVIDAIDGRFDRIDERFDRLETKVDAMIDGFRVVAEDMRHDLVGATKDRLADHERRITRLEASPGLGA